MPTAPSSAMPELPPGYRLMPRRPGTARNDQGRVISCLMRGRRRLGESGPRFRPEWVEVSAAARKVKPVCPMPALPAGVRLVPHLVGVGVTAEGVVMTCVLPGRKPGGGTGEPAFRPEWRVVAQRTDRHGYAVACAGGMPRLVHRLVLFAWVGPPADGQECRHLDGNPLNNALSNLAWGTRKENASDREAHGRTFRPAAAWPVKLTFEKAQTMRARADAGVSREQLAREFDTCPTNVRHVLSGRTWRPPPTSVAVTAAA